MIGILRRCRRCDQLLSIDDFKDVDPEQPARLCYGCVNAKSIGRASSVRTYALTAKGRAAIREMAAA